MKYFTNCKTLNELKAEYRRLVMIHHPDRGGDEEAMKAINNEYDELFPVLKLQYNQTAAEPTHETAESTRREFYTQNGWKGKNYSIDLTTTEISQKIREYVKKVYPDCKFSVTTHYASMCSSIDVVLMSGPYAATTDGSGRVDVNEYHIERSSNLTAWALAVLSDVNDFIKSYRWNDSDGMIDYFDTNFYYDISVGKYGKPYTVTSKPRKVAAPKSGSKKTESTPAALPAFRVELNNDLDGIEVYFNSKPEQATRDALKSAGYRWHSVKKCWYAKRSEERLQLLRKIEGAA